MKKLMKRFFMAALLLLGVRATGNAADLLQTNDLTLDIGGRFQELGELEVVTDDPVRDHTRVYLFNIEDRLIADGNYKGINFWFETALGGEAYSTSNNQINLLEYDANVPLTNGVSIMAGQFREPANLESADYDGNLLFSEKSSIMTMFFNMGYDTGVALSARSGDFDLIAGVEDGAPDLPQRYLPEYFSIPPMTFLRLGITDGIKDDPWHPKQTGFEKPAKPEFALHANGIYLSDSNAGHSTDAALQSSYVTVGSATTDDYSNFLLSGEWNPYLGKTAANYGPVSAVYYQASLDTEYRAPMGDTVFTLQAQVNVAHFEASNFAPITIGTLNGKPDVFTAGQLNVGGGEIQASVGEDPFIVAGRFAVVIPDAGLVNTGSGSVTLGATVNHLTGPWSTPITGSGPIYELTLPSVTWKVNADTKLVAEAMWMINTPTVFGGDGEYVLAEEPSQSSNANPINSVQRVGLVPAGHLMFQFAF